LLAWGEAAAREHTRRRRIGCNGVAVAIGGALLAATIALPPHPRLVWNASRSAPTGLYAVSPGAPIETGDMVVARLPDEYRGLAAQRRYLPSNVPLVKRVAASSGHEVCAIGAWIFVNGNPVAQRQAADGRGRRMPWWSGCIRLRADQLFLLMGDHPASFDGRYFGVTDSGDVIGKARLLWVR
jgi:conjugative transfer signal peptidase TraF